jgi:monoamine oxidase
MSSQENTLNTPAIISPKETTSPLQTTTGPLSICELLEMPKMKVGILGAGLAGLNAAKILVENGGQNVTVLEARERFGGRAHSGKLAGHVIEKGGELIDEGHTEFRDLCEELGVQLNDNYREEQTHCNFSFFVDGGHVSRDALAQAIVPFVEKMNRDIALIASGTEEGNKLKKELEHMTADKYFRDGVNIPEWAAKTMEAHLGGEWSAASETSSLIFIEYMGYQDFTPENPNLGEPGFARYTVKGGVSVLVEKMAKSILDPASSADGSAEIKLGQEIVAIRRVDNQWEVDAIVKGEKATYQFDYLLATIPYPVLRTIELTGAGLSAERMDAIESVEFTTDGKIHRVVKGSHNPDSSASTTFSDDFIGAGATDCWLDNRQEVPVEGKEQIRTHYLGCADDALVAAGSKELLLEASKTELDSQFVAGNHTGPAQLTTWHDEKFSRGAYSAWGPGEMERLEAGLKTRVEEDPVGFYSAGEAQDKEYNGYMEGAIRSGREAAQNMINDIVARHSNIEFTYN